jgi:flagellar biosynthesis protein FlhG
MAEALSDRDFSSVEEVLEVAGQTDAAGRVIAETTLRAFRPALILNRISGRSRVNIFALKKLLTEYIGGELTLLGEIPEDPSMERAVRNYLPVVDGEPTTPASVALRAIADSLVRRLSEIPTLITCDSPPRHGTGLLQNTRM